MWDSGDEEAATSYEMCPGEKAPPYIEAVANARIIAEAPAMADALDALVMEMRSIGQHLVYNAPTQGITAAMDNATAILARIRGDAP